MKLYVSGPMAGYRFHNKGAFLAAEGRLLDAGFEVANPVDNGLPDGLPPADYMRADLIMMLGCDGVATILSWRESWGACIEVDLAHRLLIPVRPLSQWLEMGVEAA